MSEPVVAGVSVSTAPRKVYDTRDDDRTAGIHGDCDDDKYRRRPALGWLAQLLRYTETQGWGVRKERPTMDNLMTVELVLGPNNTQYQGHNEALAHQAALVRCVLPRDCPFLL